ncbi:MAG: DUF1553 domain-containing protein [Bryobacteraceae bacterium]
MLRKLSIGLFATLLFAAEKPAFETGVLPILRAKCLACHGERSPQAALDLRTPESILKGGLRGPAVTPGRSERSLLVEKLNSGAMPPGKDKLTPAEVATIRAWIDEGLAPPEQQLTENDIQPIIQVRCVACHGKRKQEGGLDLRTVASRLKGGKSGPAIVPGKPDQSLMIQKVASGAMPPAKLQLEYSVRPPTDQELAKIKKWIEQGAVQGPPRSTADFTGHDPLVSDKDRQFWAFQSPRRPSAPEVKSQHLVRNPIDAFLLAKLEAKGLSFSPEADRMRLMRRAYLDLTGMPPTPAELQQYRDDTAADAYERLVDRLLESKQYGERWGRYWLDLAGYSDSEGFGQDDGVRRFAWRYRDYVVRSLNADKPYSAFLTEQIAGDEMADYTKVNPMTQEHLDRLAATGFLRTTPDPTNAPERGFIAERMNIIADEVEVLTSSVMGLTVGCARCHNHKYDPIPQRDYYRLTSILETAYDPYDWVPPKKRELEVALPEEIAQAEANNKPIEPEIKRIEQNIEKLAKPYREQYAAEVKDEEIGDPAKIELDKLTSKYPKLKRELDPLQKQLSELRGKLVPKPHVRVLMDTGFEPSTFYILRRGDALNPGEAVSPGPPSVLSKGIDPYRVMPPWEGSKSTGRRLALARWLTQPGHPLTARVAMNHVWARHFGRGIVASLSNFGRSGVAPSHPELLDWLATEFVARGWSLKKMHRLMMTSTAYRQSSSLQQPPAADPDNVLLSRMPMRRLDAESIYDSMLRATGRLDAKMFGPPAPIEVKTDKEVVVKPDKGGFRRAIYVLHRRQTPVTMFEVFDQPPMTPNCVERRLSNVATQALQMMNGTMTWDNARYMAGRLIDEAGDDRAKQVSLAYERILSRPPKAGESSDGVAAIGQFANIWKDKLAADNGEAPVMATARWQALASFCHALLNSAEFAFVD